MLRNASLFLIINSLYCNFYFTAMVSLTILVSRIKNQVKFMNISTEQILQCNQSEPLADASGRIVDLMNENDDGLKWCLCKGAGWLSDG